MNRFKNLSDRSTMHALRALCLAGVALAAGCLTVQEPPRAPAAEAPAEPAVHADTDAIDIDQSPYPRFVADPSIKGTVRCVGSSAVGLILNAIRKDFNSAEPDIELEIVSSGSGEAPKMLASGESDLAPMSRAMKPEEITMVEKARGCKLEFIDIAIDAIAVCVHRQNPLTQLSMAELDRIFGRERRRGGAPAVVWSDLGIATQPLAGSKLLLFGMGAKTGSHGIMQEIVLKGGAFRSSVNEEPVSSSVVQAVATNMEAIGYSSAYFVERTPRVRALMLEATDGSGFVGPTDEAVRSGRYPLSRSLRIYFLRDPKRPNPAAMQFLRFLVSDDGQWAIGELGQRKILPEQAHAYFRKLSK
jgi:phosphate transport system substrate-binding protein